MLNYYLKYKFQIIITFLVLYISRVRKKRSIHIEFQSKEKLLMMMNVFGNCSIKLSEI